MKKFITLKRVAMTLFVALTCTSHALAGADWIGKSYIQVNGSWYTCSGASGAWTSGAFNNYTFGSINSLIIGGQILVHGSGDADWGSGVIAMNYRIDDGDWKSHTLSYDSFGHGDYGKDMKFQSGGSTFTTETIAISGLSVGNHTLSVYFGPLDGLYDSNSGNNFVAKFTVPSTVGGTISASGWNTFSSNYNLNLSSVTNGKAFVASAASGSTVTLTSVEDKIVAAGTGLMIKGSPDAAFTISVTAAAATFSGTNKLVGLPNGGTVTKASNNYVFGWKDAASPGFYYIDSESSEPTLDAGKSYLHTDSPLSARLFIDFEENGDVTGIANVNSNKEFNGDFYNLSGQKVQNPTKGLYIVNGKKAIIK